MKLPLVLQHYGFNEKQAHIYLACLELGSASAQAISRKVGLARSTCYEVIETLKKQNLILEFKKKTVRYFSAEDPKNIIAQSKQKTEMLEQALPQFAALYKTATEHPTVRFYQGADGMKLILNEITKEADELLSFSSVDDLWELLGDYWQTFIAKRIKNKIPARVILRESTKARERQRLGIHELRQVRIIPQNYSHHGAIFIWNKKIAMFSFETEPVALLIESAVLAETQKKLFDALWDTLPV